MQMTLVPGFRDLFGEPKIPYEEWLKDIPSPLGALLAITLNRELDLSQDDDRTRFDLMSKVCWRFSLEQKEHVFTAFKNYRNRTQGRYGNEFFERWYLLEMVVRELNRNQVFEGLDDGPQQEYNFLMAYALIIDEANAIQGAMAKAASEGPKDDLFLYRMVWTGLIYQFQFQEKPDPAYEFYKLVSILHYASDKYKVALRDYLRAMGLKSIGNLMGSFMQVAQGAVKPGEDPFLPSLKYYNPLPGVDDSHLRTSAINLNMPTKAKTSDLRKFPMFYRPDKGYAVIDQGFFFKKIYRGTQFDLRSKSGLRKEMEGDVYNSDIAEYVLEKICFKSILSSMKVSRRETLLFDDGSDNSPDSYYGYKMTSLLFEFKGNMFPDRLLEKPSFETFKAYIDDRFVQNKDGKRKGVSQLAYQIDLMAKGKASWEPGSDQGKSIRKRRIFPVLSFDDYYFTMPGVNEYLNQAFQEKLTEDAKAKFDIMPVTLINLDVLYYLSIRKTNFGELEALIIRYWKIIHGRAHKHRKSGATGDFLPRMASFDEIFHSIMISSFKGRLSKNPMTTLLDLGNITQESLDAEV
jgi:hypothetical protein